MSPLDAWIFKYYRPYHPSEPAGTDRDAAEAAAARAHDAVATTAASAEAAARNAATAASDAAAATDDAGRAAVKAYLALFFVILYIYNQVFTGDTSLLNYAKEQFKKVTGVDYDSIST